MTERSSTATADAELYALRDLIASHIECEKDCKAMPTGCGCALTAARAVLNRPAQLQLACGPATWQLRRPIEGGWSEWQNVVEHWDGSRNPAFQYRPLYPALSQGLPCKMCGGTTKHRAACVNGPALPSTDRSPPSGNAGEGAEPQTIPNTDPARQFPLYELMPDFTLHDRDPQADERLKLYRDIFAEITAKAIPVCDGTSTDPERVRHYIIPVGPLHRAAGKLGFQLFNGERHLADAVNEIARLKAAPPQPAPDALREACKSSIKRIDELLHDNDCDGAHKELHELAYQFEMLSTPLPSGEPPNAETSHDGGTP